MPFNDAEALVAALDETVAGVILEPAMMNVNIVPPEPGYLEAVRAACDQAGVVLIFDEVKTGAAVAAGGATELYGVVPDVVCLAKAMCGGLPGGAVGMTAALGVLVAEGRVKQQGTFNGNPLTMAAAQATLLHVLTDDAYTSLHALNERLMRECERVIAEYELPAHTVGMGSKGCVVMSTEPVLRVPRLPHQDPPRAHRPRLALPHEPRRLHDARPGRGMDALGHAHRRRSPTLHRRVRDLRPRGQRGVRSSDSATSSRWDELEVTEGRRTGEFFCEVEVMA